MVHLKVTISVYLMVVIIWMLVEGITRGKLHGHSAQWKALRHFNRHFVLISPATVIKFVMKALLLTSLL